MYCLHVKTMDIICYILPLTWLQAHADQQHDQEKEEGAGEGIDNGCGGRD